jgi:hypothetical protein
MTPTATAHLLDSATALRAAALELLDALEQRGFVQDAELAEAVARMQDVTSDLAAVVTQLDALSGRERLLLSRDAAIVLGLASTALPFATSLDDEAERWLRVLRLHGKVGAVLQSLGVAEAPLMTPSSIPAERADSTLDDPVAKVRDQAQELSRRRGGRSAGTVDLLFAIFALYGASFDRALYVRGTSRAEVIERLRDEAGVAGLAT